MTYRSPFLFCAILFFGPIFLTAQNINEGLLLHYPLNGDAADVSGNEFDGTVTGAVPAPDRQGAPMGAMSFGGDARIELPRQGALRPQPPLTLSFWLYLDDTGPGNRAVLTTDYVANTYFGVTVGLDDAGRPVVTLAGNGQAATFAGMTPLTPGRWHHLAVVVRSVDDLSLYLSGCQETGTFSGAVAALRYGDGRGNLGRANAGTTAVTNTLRGRLDDFRYWNRALGETEINRLYDQFYTPAISLGNDTMICTGETLVLRPETTVDSWTWNDGSTLTELTVSQTGQYWVSAQTEDCQEISDTINVMVGYCDQCEPQTPNVFTPNGDGNNDTFRVLFDIDKCRIVQARVMIYNRWGKKVFESDGVDDRWDGRSGSQEMPSDVYVYVVRYAYETEAGRVEREIQGDLTLLR